MHGLSVCPRTHTHRFDRAQGSSQSGLSKLHRFDRAQGGVAYQNEATSVYHNRPQAIAII